MYSRVPLTARVACLLLCLSLYGRTAGAQTVDCTTPPPPDPRKNFFENFVTPCYAVRLPANLGSGREMTDPDQTYGGFFYRVNPNYELIIFGEFPSTRTLSVTIDDAHFSNQDWYNDTRLTPLRAADVNTFATGVTYREDQLYAVTITFGGSDPDPGVIMPGCSMTGLNTRANLLDATTRHSGMNWNTDPRVPDTFPRHDDGPNAGGLITVRQYVRDPTADAGRLRLAWPVIVARDLRTGCAVPPTQVFATDPANVLPDHVLTRIQDVAETWVDLAQMRAHEVYRDHLRTFCYQYSPPQWIRPNEYIPLPNPDAAYLVSHLHPDRVASLISGKAFMRLRFRLPTLPTIPCVGCVLTGLEELRYFNLSFFDRDRNTLASLGDFEVVKDANGYATVVVGFGGERPADVTPENGYTYVDLSLAPGFENLSLMALRHLRPNDAFQCSAKAVRNQFGEDNSLGGFMGEYAPVVDFLLGSSLTGPAQPLVHPNSCGAIPPEPPVVCYEPTAGAQQPTPSSAVRTLPW